MMGDLLYIDGVAVDLGEGVDITLNYKSNLLTELDKIVGNNSYTIKLPKTARNLGIIGNSDIPAGVGQYPRVTHEARYFRNGVEVIPSGSAVLLGVGDSIEVVLTWGVSEGLIKLAEDDTNLNEFTSIEDSIQWNLSNSKSVYDGVSEIVNADIRFGLVAGEELATIHPSVRSTYILNLITKKYGVTFDFPEERVSFINSLIVPLLTRNGGYANSQGSTGNVSYNELTGGYVLKKTGADFDKFFEPEAGPRDYVLVFRALVDGRVTIRPTFKSPRPDKGVGYGTENIEDNFDYFPYRLDPDATERTVYLYETPIEIDLMAGDLFGVNLMNANAIGFNGTYFEFEMSVTEIQIGDKFPIAENLPGMSSLDFVKAIASISGLFCVVSEGSSLKFVTFDTLIDRGRAVDWTDKLIAGGYSNKPRAIEYTLDDFARRNKMLWAEDDTVNVTTANSLFFVNDVTLDYERDAVELPFAASDVHGGKATIRIYTYPNEKDNADPGDPELQSVEPRILIEKNVGGYSTGTFNGLQWSSLLATHWQSFQNIVRRPVVIVEDVYLNEFDLRDLDMTRAVYLGQYGRYYAVVEVKAPKSGVCECKLLQLDI